MNDTKEFVSSLLEVHDSISKKMEPVPSFIRITTITSLTKIHCGLELLDMEKIKEAFKNGIKIKKTGSKKGSGFLWTLKENGFYNQATIEYRDSYSKKSIKIFPNCTIHITGCYNIDDCKNVVRQLCFMFNFIVKPVEECTCDPCKIVMINTNFSVNSILDLSNIISSMKSKGATVTFNPETYSAVKIKFIPEPGMKQITASIFSSGKIIITGAVNLKEIIASYRFILKTISDEPKTILRAAPDIDIFGIFMGYSLDSQWRNEILSW
jgi:TATA-box binding protein (TBP) (component of TFIID and TFIIIB)